MVGPEAFDHAYAPFAAERARLVPDADAVLDAHTHLGVDEDGSSLSLERLLGMLDEVGPRARACVFPLHDPDREPAYRRPNDRVLEWAAQSDGRLVPYCRLDPAEGPVAEAERCLARGARGIKLHPRAQAFGFGDPAAEAIFAVARDAGVPILVHAGRGMATMEPLAELALRYPEVTLVLAHAAIADQGIFATRLADHPAVLYDTSCFAPADVIELFARVPAERIVFASDAPYGRPTGGLYLAMRVAALAGLDADDRALVAGGTRATALDGAALAAPRLPRLPAVRAVSGRLDRVSHYLVGGFAAVIGGPLPPDPTLALPWIALARAVCRDPDPGAVGPVLRRIDGALDGAGRIMGDGGPQAFAAIGLLMAAAAMAATEPVA